MTTEITVLPTPIDVTDDEVATILQELNLVALTKPVKEGEIKKQEAMGVDVRKLIRLGIFADGMTGVQTRAGTMFVAETIIRNQMLRLEAKAQQMESANELKEISYPLGYLHGQLLKSKSKIVILEANAAPLRARTESWEPGQTVLPPVKSA